MPRFRLDPIVFAIALLIVGAGVARAAACDAPQPKLRPGAASGVPAVAAAFAGTWQGTWPTAARNHVYPRCARLYVNITGATNATVEQCVGGLREGRLKPECKQYVAQIIGNELTFTDFDGTIYSFDLADVGGMLAKEVSAAHKSVTNFTKVE